MAISRASIARLKKDLAKSEPEPDRWGKPLDLSGWSDQQLADRMEELQSSIVVDMTPYDGMDVSELISAYVALIQ